MVKLEWGHKRTCQGCGVRFYDLQKSPPSCPKCGSIVEIITASRGRKGKSDTSKKAALLSEVELIDDIGIVDDLALDIDVDADLMEDTNDLDESIDDLAADVNEDKDDL